MSLMTQAYLLDKYGPRLDIDQMSEVLNLNQKTLLNKISAGTCPIRTYLDGGKRWADVRDVAERFDALRAQAA